MPSTITAYYTFNANTKARSSEVNTNFSNYRGDLLPINENTTTASDGSHDLGSVDHYWQRAFLENAKFRAGATTSAYYDFQSNLASTAGALSVVSGDTSTTVFALTQNGYDGDTIADGTGRRLQRKYFTAVTTTSNTVVIPADVDHIFVAGWGGGGGGAGGASGGGGGPGGWGSFPLVLSLNVTAGETITVLTIGAGGAGSSSTGGTIGAAGASGAATVLTCAAGTLTFHGAPGAPSAGSNPDNQSSYLLAQIYKGHKANFVPGGARISSGTLIAGGTAGADSPFASGGSANVASGGFGGGGGAGFGAGAAGGASALADGFDAAANSGGGGGGGGQTSGDGGNGGSGGLMIYCVTRYDWEGTV